MKWLNTDVCPVQAALQQRPKVFHRVRVDVPVDILDRVIDLRAENHLTGHRTNAVHQ